MNIEENIIFRTHPHPLHFLIFYISGVVIIIFGYFFWWPLYLIGVLVFALGEAARRAETFVISEQGLSRQYKFLATSNSFTEYDKIQNIEVRQSFLERLFGIGCVHLDTAGGDKTEINFEGIYDPYKVESIIRGKLRT